MRDDNRFPCDGGWDGVCVVVSHRCDDVVIVDDLLVKVADALHAALLAGQILLELALFESFDLLTTVSCSCFTALRMAEAVRKSAALSGVSSSDAERKGVSLAEKLGGGECASGSRSRRSRRRTC